MFEDIEMIPPSEDEHPQARAWLWVLTYPVTVNRDNMVILEGEDGDYIPIFKEKAEAEVFWEKIGGQELYYQVQALHLFDARKFAKEKALDLVTLTGQGQILERWNHNSPLSEEPTSGESAQEEPAEKGPDQDK
jgi:hypothetical protein